MKKYSHLIGGILLVAGTTIGAGLLGLPITTGFMGFFPSILLFILTWSMMLLTGFYFVDVNLAMEGEINLITMAGKTLGPLGKIVSWVVYLLLLYSLIAAYIAGCAPLFVKGFEVFFGATISLSFGKFILPVLFGGIVYFGIRGVDLINRIFMFGLIVSYLVLTICIPRHIQWEYLQTIHWKPFFYATPVVVTAFGYHIIIPSITTYVKHDRKSLYTIIIVGSLIALFVNLFWQFLILGVIPLNGEGGLAAAWQMGIPITEPLAKIVKNPILATGAYFFSFFAIITSFMGVALSLADFLIDGLKIKKSWEGRLLAILLTFIPPLIFVFSYERGFLLALQYAGTFVAILLIFLPSAMAWTLDSPKFYKSWWGRVALVTTALFSFFVVIIKCIT